MKSEGIVDEKWKQVAGVLSMFDQATAGRRCAPILLRQIFQFSVDCRKLSESFCGFRVGREDEPFEGRFCERRGVN